jgi:hypothetical protein
MLTAQRGRRDGDQRLAWRAARCVGRPEIKNFIMMDKA